MLKDNRERGKGRQTLGRAVQVVCAGVYVNGMLPQGARPWEAARSTDVSEGP